MYLNDEKLIELTYRSIDKEERTFESLRNRMYWMLTIVCIVTIPLLAVVDYGKVSARWMVLIYLLGSIFILTSLMFYMVFVRPKKLPSESPEGIYKRTESNDKFVIEYFKHLLDAKIKWEKVNIKATRYFFCIMFLFALVLIGVIIFLIRGGGF